MKKVQLFLLSVLLTGCVTSYQARDVKPSAFLGDSASLLSEGRKGEEALLVYRKENTDWASYRKIILEPVAIWSATASTLSADQQADYQRLVDNFSVMLGEKLSKSYEMTTTPAPDAMRIQAAIINGEQARRALKVAKTIAPYAFFADTVWKFATGKPAFAGEVSIEYMIKDSQSGELLAAGADRRVGGNQIGRSTLTSWGDMQNVLTYWSDATVYQLCVDRGARDCVRPREGLVKDPLM